MVLQARHILPPSILHLPSGVADICPLIFFCFTRCVVQHLVLSENLSRASFQSRGPLLNSGGLRLIPRVSDVIGVSNGALLYDNRLEGFEVPYLVTGL